MIRGVDGSQHVEVDPLRAKWVSYRQDHAAQIPPKALPGSRANRIRASIISGLYQRFLRDHAERDLTYGDRRK